MPNLLCLTDELRVSNTDDILGKLVPRWKTHFDKVIHWVIPNTDEPTPWVDLAEGIRLENITHIWAFAGLEKLYKLATNEHAPINKDELHEVVTYAYADICSPMVDSKYAELLRLFDFFMVPYAMAGSAMQRCVLALPHKPSKDIFSALKAMSAIPVGVNNYNFFPHNIHAREYGREEIKQAMFGDKISNRDFMIMIMGPYSRKKGIPQAFSILAQLIKKSKDRRVRAYVHAPENEDMKLLAFGNGLIPGEDVFFGDKYFVPEKPFTAKKLNYIFNGMDLLLCTDIETHWPLYATSAMAAGLPVASTDDFVWLDITTEGRGILLPASDLGWAPWPSDYMVRTVNTGAATEILVSVMNDSEKYNAIRETGLAWAHKDPLSDWNNIADMWLKAFGVA